MAGDRTRSSRYLSLDALRGLIIALMALDHANYFVAQKHSPGEYWGGKFPVYDDALAFLTRLVTHLSAPGFFFLMGAGMVLLANSPRKQGWREGAIIRHLLLRGGVLITLQILVINRAWELPPGAWDPGVYIGVLFALGGTMMIGSFLYAAFGNWLTPDGTSIIGMYPYWLLGLLILFPVCSWYGQLKGRQSATSILRFL